MNLITLRADTDARTTGQFYIVAVGDANGDFDFAGAGAKTVHPIGVLQNKPNAGEFGTIATSGTSKIVMAENCSRGDIIVGSDATTGTGEVADADGEFGIGIALEANAEGSGGIIEVLIVPGICHHQ